jgi:hypothetical protein
MRPIHKMVLIIPVEEQTVGKSEEEAKVTEPKMQEPEAVNKEKTQEAKADEPLQAGNITEDNPSSKREVKGKSVQKVKHKKINPRKKAGKQTRTIIVTVPAKSEEVKDVGATAKRKRGRPKKIQGADSSDPRKGGCSVPWKGSVRGP